AILEETDNPALLRTKIVHAHVLMPRKLPPQQGTKRLDPRLNRSDAHPHGIAGGDAQADLTRYEALPAFKPACVLADLVGVRIDPGSSLQVNKGRLKHPNRVPTHEQKSRATRPAQIFPTGGRQHLTPDLLYIHHELSDRLAGIEQIQD